MIVGIWIVILWFIFWVATGLCYINDTYQVNRWLRSMRSAAIFTSILFAATLPIVVFIWMVTR